MYSTVLDLAKFQSCLFANGKIREKQLLKPESLKEMFRPQFAKGDGERGFGLGFMMGELDGKKRIGHGGAIYGFATEFAALPNEKVGAVVVCSRDVSNALMTHIANVSLRALLAAKEGKGVPKIETSEPLSQVEALSLVGRYRTGDGVAFELVESAGRLFLLPTNGGSIIQLRKSGKDLISDDVQSMGLKLSLVGDKIAIGKATFTREKPSALPPEAPAKWKGLIGEYGWDHNTLFIYESDGRVYALIEWIEIDPLTEESENVFAFPANRGMYHGEKLVFTRDANGRATKVEAAKVVFERRAVKGENGETYKLDKPVRPLDQLRKEALAATPPLEKGEFRKFDLVDLATIEGLKFDIRYATTNNFLDTPFYTSAKAFMQRPAAEALAKVQKKIQEQGYGLIIYDAYRPWYVTKMFWDATPEKFHGFVADPSKGSRHNRGCAVDLGLYHLNTGKVAEMVSGYDEMTDRAFPDYLGGSSRERWHRALLRKTMEEENFTVYEEEWWHYDFKDWRKYPILNLTFEQLAEKK